MRLGLIGCGRIAELGYLPAIAAVREVELAAVADPSRERRMGIADAGSNGRRVSAHRDARALVETAGLDAVIVASPPDDHLASAGVASAAGLPTLVEKPPAPGLEASIALATLRPVPWIGFNRRFQQGLALSGAVPASGPLELELELRYRRSAWGARSVRDDAVLDLAPHLVDLAFVLSGACVAEIMSVSCSSERAELDLALGRSRARIRCATDRAHRERVVIKGEGRVATWSTPGPARGLVRRAARRPHPLVESLARQLTAFVSAVRGGDPGPLATADDGVRAMAAIEAARASA